MGLVVVLDDDDDAGGIDDPRGWRSGPLVEVPPLRPLDELPKGSPEHDGLDNQAWERPEALRPPRPMMVPHHDGEPRCVQDRPCVVVTYARPWTPSTPSEVVEVRVTAETLDPGWWRAQLGRVAFVIELYAEGNSTPEGVRAGRRLFAYGPDGDPTPVRVELPKMVLVQFPGSAELVAAMPTGRDIDVRGEATPVLRVSDAGAAKLRAAWAGRSR